MIFRFRLNPSLVSKYMRARNIKEMKVIMTGAFSIVETEMIIKYDKCKKKIIEINNENFLNSKAKQYNKDNGKTMPINIFCKLVKPKFK